MAYPLGAILISATLGTIVLGLFGYRLISRDAPPAAFDPLSGPQPSRGWRTALGIALIGLGAIWCLLALLFVLVAIAPRGGGDASTRSETGPGSREAVVGDTYPTASKPDIAGDAGCLVDDASEACSHAESGA